MKNKGICGIGCIGMKNDMNYGTLFRSAQIFNADFLFLIGERFKKQSSDTMHSWKHMPVYSFVDFEDFDKHRPFNCELIGIEMCERSKPISEFKHPKQAIYLLGSEDNGISENVLSKCQQRIYLSGERSLNVAVAGSFVLFDRFNQFDER